MARESHHAAWVGLAGPHHGAPGQFPVLGLRDRDHAQRRATLGDAAFEAAHRRARSLSHADAIAMVRYAIQAGIEAGTPSS